MMRLRDAFPFRLSRVRLPGGGALLAAAFLAAGLAAPPTAPAQETDLLERFEERVTEFTLDNGLTFVVIERHEAPVVSFNTYADVGSVDEPRGQTGIAHMFEHMAFKGTTSIGTEDIEAETEALRRQEEAYLALRRERARGARADSARIDSLQAAFEEATARAESLIAEGEFENLLQRHGVQGMNAQTSTDWTRYFYSLPANKLELFFALESDRFVNPVLREFYTERDVVMEERRSSESSPVGRLLEEFLTTAFKAHPYGQPTIGHMSDLERLSRTDAKEFYERYYGARNLTIGIAGDVDPERVRELAEEYFGRLAEGREPPSIRTQEPEQIGERRVIIREQTQPFVLVGYHRSGGLSEDAAAYDVLQDVLARGRTSRLYRNLVETQLAVQVQAIPEFPGSKHPTLFAILGVPNRGVSPDSVEHAIYEQLDRIREEGITEEELERAKTRARSDLIGQLDSNSGLAYQLSRMEALTGDWRDVFRDLEELQAVTAEEVRRAAEETFRRENRTVAMIRTEEDESSGSDGGSGSSGGGGSGSSDGGGGDGSGGGSVDESGGGMEP